MRKRYINLHIKQIAKFTFKVGSVFSIGSFGIFVFLFKISTKLKILLRLNNVTKEAKGKEVIAIYVSGGSRISPRRGRQLSGGAPGYYFIKISRKLHEIKDNSAPREGRASPAPPLRSATVMLCWQFKKKPNGHLSVMECNYLR